MKRDTSNQLLPARDAFHFVDLINQIWLAQHPEILEPPKPEQPCPKESTQDRDQSDS